MDTASPVASAKSSKGVTIFMAGLGMVMLLSNGQIARLLSWLRERTGKSGGIGSGTGGSGADGGSAPVMTAPGGSQNAAPSQTIPSGADLTGAMGITPAP